MAIMGDVIDMYCMVCMERRDRHSRDRDRGGGAREKDFILGGRFILVIEANA